MMFVMMVERKIEELLNNLIATWENEIIEFKEADNSFSTHEIGKYFSALANEANLRGLPVSWLIFGVNNKKRAIAGTNYRLKPEHLQSLKMQIAENTEPSVTFRDILEIFPEGLRILLFEIPAAPRGIPISWKGHYYARAGESLVSLGLDKIDEIRRQTIEVDWTAQIVQKAGLEHLDDKALYLARQSFTHKYANRFAAEEIDEWPQEVFLDRARITQEGRITRTALLLLGKPESAYLLSPHPAQLVWKLEGRERAYEHFAPPFLLQTTALYRRIRNIKIRLLPDSALVSIEIAKYDQKIILEALHNCIAHQDYLLNGRVIVTEHDDRLTFENVGTFFEGSPYDYIEGTKTPRRYRNPFLAQAMAELNMIDTMGYGIHEIYTNQARRYLPMPDYDLDDPSSVRMVVYGGVVDEAYTRMLMDKTELPLSDILALDRVQKKLPLPDAILRRLRKSGLVEGRKPHIRVSATIAHVTIGQEKYMKLRGEGDAFCAKLILDYLSKSGDATRKTIDDLLWDKLSGDLSDEEKKRKIANMLTRLRRAGSIRNTGSRKTPIWKIAE